MPHRLQLGENPALELKAVTNDRRASVLIPFAGRGPEKLLNLGLQGLGNQPLRTVAKYQAQKTLHLYWLASFNYRILPHGWRDHLWVLPKRLQWSHSGRARRLLQLITYRFG